MGCRDRTRSTGRGMALDLYTVDQVSIPGTSGHLSTIRNKFWAKWNVAPKQTQKKIHAIGILHLHVDN